MARRDSRRAEKVGDRFVLIACAKICVERLVVARVRQEQQQQQQQVGAQEGRFQ